MSNNFDKKINDEEDDESGSGQGGRVEFKEFVTSERLRDDLLSKEEGRRLVTVHNQLTEALIKKQKLRREEYKSLKEGKIKLDTFRQHVGGSNAGYKSHPAFHNKAQFSGGTDKNVIPLPNENNANTNNDKKNELEYKLANRLSLTNAPKPKLTPTPFR